MAPWSILVCLKNAEDDLAENAYRAWNSTLKNSVDYEENDLQGIERIQPTEEPPVHIRQLLQGELNEPPDSNLKYIAVFQQTEIE